MSEKEKLSIGEMKARILAMSDFKPLLFKIGLYEARNTRDWFMYGNKRAVKFNRYNPFGESR